MDIYLIDGTYELFRYFYAVPSSKNASGQEIGAVRGVLGSILTMIEGGATHIGVATDHVIESFRNDLYRDYKTGEGVDPELLSQFPILEKALQSMGVLAWAMMHLLRPQRRQLRISASGELSSARPIRTSANVWWARESFNSTAAARVFVTRRA